MGRQIILAGIATQAEAAVGAYFFEIAIVISSQAIQKIRVVPQMIGKANAGSIDWLVSIFTGAIYEKLAG